MNDGLARTPPMGWNSWNKFSCHIDENIVREIADAMVSTGMKDAGYEYVVIDDCWMAPTRDANGNLQPDSRTFPHGIKALADYVHSKGLKFGIYSCNGTRTCQGLPASLGYEEQDARLFASWDVDYLKYDFCYSEKAVCEIDKITVDGVDYEAEAPENVIEGGAAIGFLSKCSGERCVSQIGEGSGSLEFTSVHVPRAGCYQLTIQYVHRGGDVGPRAVFMSVNGKEGQRLRLINWTYERDAVSTLEVPVELQEGGNRIRFYNPYTSREITIQNYTKMSQALQATGRPIVFSLCEWGTHRPWEWGAPIAHLWRTTGDIFDKWESVLSILDRQVGLERYAGPGGWNDPDMLEVGNGGMTATEYRAHFSLWCLLNAPLMAGNDLRHMDEETRAILTNKEVIAVNQDPAGVQGSRIRKDGDQEVWAKVLANGDRAVILFNRGESDTLMEVSLAELGFGDAGGTAASAGAAGAPGAHYVARDLWEHRDVAFNGEGKLRAVVPGHGVAMFRVGRCPK